MASSRQQQGSKPRQQAADQEELLDPSYDWQENADNFLLRIHLSGFRKQDFKVQVDGAGRLTVRGQRTDAAATADASRHSRLNKVFQLPATANLEDISGRFEAGVLMLTVPKKGQPGPGHGKQQQQSQEAPNNNKQAAKPAEAEEPSKPTPPPPKQAMATKKPTCAPGKPVEDATTTTKKPGAAEQAEAKIGEPPVQDQRKATAAPPAGSAAPTTTADKNKEEQAAGAAPAAKQQAAAPPTDKKPAGPADSLAEKAKRRDEEEAERAKAAKPAATAAEEAPPRRGFRERVAEELQGLAASDWAEGLLDTVKKNREVIAVAVAAFSLGLFVSSRLCSSSRN